MAVEKTLILIKPDGVKRRLTGEVIKRLEQKGLNIKGLKMMKLSVEKAEKHYSVHNGKPFFKDLVSYITSGPIIAMVAQGNNSISVVRGLVGATDGSKAAPGTIRGDFSISIDKNIIHASDSVESFNHEYPIFFEEPEILDFSYGDEKLF
ncbi:MAG: nucleoside-diphosphate kinase [Candidatus Thermoplasmatota archaeon]|nr:nucleoside-diphosphate kinase [Candidatus Thermoplasmatota archaeon]MCL5888760.1 nucleoside-diphosphate kinase [Candidatus Thermoplasmatota archaeon]